MGKKYKANKFNNKKAQDDDDHMEKLQLLAEKLGKNIWEITPDDEEHSENSENSENSEEAQESHESHESHEDEGSLAESIEITEEEGGVNVGEQFEKADAEPEGNEVEDATAELGKQNEAGSEQIQIDNTKDNTQDTPLQDGAAYPKRMQHTDEITKMMEKIELPQNDNKKQGLISFHDVKTTYLYPKEQNLPKSAINTKKKKKQDNFTNFVSNKKKDKDQDDDTIEDEELKRLEEVRRKREEFAFLEKLKQEELQKKKEDLLKSQEETVEKKNYKPKGKKKKGK
jgi:hypothetical protein